MSPIEYFTIKTRFHCLSFNNLLSYLPQLRVVYHSILTLRLTSSYETTYSDDEIWEDLISTTMPHWHTFDVNHDNSLLYNPSKYHSRVEQFIPSFCTKKKCFFSRISMITNITIQQIHIGKSSSIGFDVYTFSLLRNSITHSINKQTSI